MPIRNKFKNILGSIGNTPLMRLDFPVKPLMLAKLEMLNPGGSLKDRTALHMIEVAERTGQLKPGGTIIEASSGSQGISLAMIGKVKGYRVIIVVPDRTAPEKVAVLRAYGAEVYMCPNTDSHEDPRNYHTFTENLVHSIPGAFMPNQYFNKENPRAHYVSTGPEIWEQTEGKITHFVCAAGSCGVISGVGRYLKDQNPAVKVIGVDAATSRYSSPENPKAYTVEGIGVDVISDTFDATAFDVMEPITDADAFAMTKRLAMDHGYLVGLSSGAVMHVALEYAKNLTEDDVMVVMFGDSGRNYLSKVFADEVKKVKSVEAALEHGVISLSAE